MRFTLHRVINKDEKRNVNYADFLEALGKKSILPYPKNDVDYVFKIDLTERYCFLEIKYGNTKAKDCFDKQENVFKSNILGENITHTGEQFFVFMNFETDVLSISNFDKKGVLISYFKEHGINLEIFDVNNNIDEFLKQISKVRTVKLKATNNLFLQRYFTPLYNLDWDNAQPESTELKLNFNCEIDKKVLKKNFDLYKNDEAFLDVEFLGQNQDDQFLSINKKALVSKQEIMVKKQEEKLTPKFKNLNRMSF